MSLHNQNSRKFFHIYWKDGKEEFIGGETLFEAFKNGNIKFTEIYKIDKWEEVFSRYFIK